MTAIDYAALVERLRGEQKLQQDEYGRGLHVLDEAADALERLTQPGGEVEPVATIRECNGVYQVFWHKCPPDDGTKLCVAPDLARLIAERDAARSVAISQAAAICSGLAKIFTDHRIGFDKGYSMAAERAEKAILALAATEPMKHLDADIAKLLADNAESLYVSTTEPKEGKS